MYAELLEAERLEPLPDVSAHFFYILNMEFYETFTVVKRLFYMCT